MELPILSKLQDGEKFDFDTLAENFEQTEEHWHWWWAEKAVSGRISRPEIIADDDPVLAQTLGKTTVDLRSHEEFFDRHLVNAIKADRLPSTQQYDRAVFRERVIRLLHGSSTRLEGQPHIIFAGGGYGSGKTTTLNKLAEAGVLAVEMRHMVGVDTFKMFMPEFQLIKGVGDGRASLTVQQECVQLGSHLFDDLVSAQRSFIWDSSMSDEPQTLERIRMAREQGYHMTMVAVLTPLQVAISQAMRRACITRRFPHPTALPGSHVGFRKAFPGYVPLFDEVRVFANFGAEHGGCYEVAQKEQGENALAFADEEMFLLALSSPEDPHSCA